MDHIIACDCGGTKCAFLLCATDGTVRASVTGGTGNSSFESSEAIAAKIRALLLQLREESGVDPASVTAWGGATSPGGRGDGALQRRQQAAALRGERLGVHEICEYTEYTKILNTPCIFAGNVL